MGMSRVFEFGENVIKTLTDLLGEQFPMDPYIHLLNDDSTLGLTLKARNNNIIINLYFYITPLYNTFQNYHHKGDEVRTLWGHLGYIAKFSMQN